ncbi:DUF2637 domain-containing protein [Streptomonospora sp. PA3]|uniref:DUF2637 domain-containing protein n=1 Tax=Streptomonospora sp. PA3 TaxID=2607326 RepID=UPI0016435583
MLLIAACAVLLSYNGIYQIAVQGNVSPRYAHLYPAAFTLLVLMALWTSYVLRTARRSRRLWADGIILLLVALAAGASALRAGNLELVPDVAVVVAAVAPWVALMVAFRLFLWVVMQLRGEIPGTGPHRTRRERRAERRAGSGPAAGGGQDTLPLDDLLPENSRHPVGAEEPGRQGDEDAGGPPRPRDPEPADFREPGLHPPRPAPTGRPSRPQRPARPEPPESPEPQPGPVRTGATARRSPHAGAGDARAEAPEEAADPAAGPRDSAEGAGSDDADGTAPLWPNAAGPTSAVRPESDGARADASAPAVHSDESDEWAWADSDDDSADQRPATAPEAAAEERSRAASAAAQAGTAAADAPAAETATGPGAPEADPVAGPAGQETEVPNAVPDEAPAAAGAADSASASAACPASESAVPASVAAAAAPAPDEAPDEAPELPRRTPGAADNPIKRAADAPTAAEPVGRAEDAAAAADTEQVAASLVGPGEDPDGFVHELPLGDPTSDEGEPDAGALAVGAPAAAEDGREQDGDSRDAGPDEPPRGPAYPAAPPIEKRPMVLRPRRSPRGGASSPFPEDPPSNRVRSEPKPPEG